MKQIKDFAKRERIKNYREQGLSFSEIGKLIGISRQRVYQIHIDYVSPYRSSLKYKKRYKKYRKKYDAKNRKKKQIILRTSKFVSRLGLSN